MFSLLLAGAMALLLALLLTPLWRNSLLRLGFADANDLHAAGRGSIPRMGGAVVLLAAAIGVLLPILLHMGVSRGVHPDRSLIAHLSVPVLLVLALGLWDDAFGVSARFKLAVQVCAALLVFAGNVRVSSVFGETLPVWLSLLLTVGWLVACTNAFNLLDGLDGLATGVALFAAGTVLVYSITAGNLALALLTTALCGALAGFLVFNFPPASIFLGDAGSLSIGFLLGCFALLWADKATTMLGLAAPLLALVLPLFDTGLAIVRRWISGEPVFGGDQRHIHHRLVQLGFTPRGALLVLYGVAVAAALSALLLTALRQTQTSGLVILVLIPIAWVAVQNLRYAEFAAAQRVWLSGLISPRRAVRQQLDLARALERLREATDLPGLWMRLVEMMRLLAVAEVELRLGPAEAPLWQSHRELTPPTRGEARQECWSLQLPLSAGAITGQLVLRKALAEDAVLPVAGLAKTLQQTVSERVLCILRDKASAADDSGATPAAPPAPRRDIAAAGQGRRS